LAVVKDGKARTAGGRGHPEARDQPQRVFVRESTLKLSRVPPLVIAALACAHERVPLDLTSASLVNLPDTAYHVRMQINPARRELVLVGGPFRVPSMPTAMGHATMSMGERDSVLCRFVWPQDAWLRGFDLELRDEGGHPVPRSLLHHLTMVNRDRRQLVYPIAERVVSFGKETEAISLPTTIGMPLKAGQRITLYAMWDNNTGREVQGVYLVLTFRWASHNQVPRPIEVFPLFIDANRVVGGHDMFDVPPGGCVKTSEFTLPVGGHLLAVGGHLHDHGVSLQVTDAGTGKTLVRLSAERDQNGTLLRVSRQLFAVRGLGLRLRADHPYRLVAVYDNPTSDTLRAVMGYLGGLFAPNDARRWPAIDTLNEEFRVDMLALSGPVYRPGAMHGDPCRPSRSGSAR
jgi:hypothetical protein